MEYSITSICKNLSTNWQKYVLDWKKWSFESIANSAHTPELLALGKFLNVYCIVLYLFAIYHKNVITYIQVC